MTASCAINGPSSTRRGVSYKGPVQKPTARLPGLAPLGSGHDEMYLARPITRGVGYGDRGEVLLFMCELLVDADLEPFVSQSNSGGQTLNITLR